MGNCASPQKYQKNDLVLNNSRQSTAKIIHIDGKLQEFKHPIKAIHILSQNPNSFLCSSESMNINSHLPHVPLHEELQLGQIYFLFPLSKSNSLLSLQDLCSLAIKASKALDESDSKYSSKKTLTYGVKSAADRFYKISGHFDIVGVKFSADKNNLDIKL